MDAIESCIWKKFRIKRKDVLPFTGWAGTRGTLAEVFAEVGFTKGCEVGVKKGHYSEMLCKTIPNLDLFCVDPWRSFARNKQESMDSYFEEAKKRLAPYNITFIKKPSLDAAKGIPNESLDFVYIDGLHEFNPVMLDLIFWSEKVKIGGIVAGHDYYNFYQSGVVTAVDAFIKGNGINPWYVVRHEREPTFFWVKRFQSLGMKWI